MQGQATRQLVTAGMRLWAVVRLLRPLNFVLFLAGVTLGGFLSGGEAAFEGLLGVRLFMAALSAALIGGAANSLNDVYDLEIDRINRPSRPLPSGLVGPRVAWGLWVLGTAAGVLLSVRLSAVHVVMALTSAALLFAYSAVLKRTLFTGNLVVALVVALALVYGGWAVGPPGSSLVAAAFAFLTTLAREVVKDMEDSAGDAALGARTLPVVRGPAAAVKVTTVLIGLTILLTPLPFLLLDYSGLFLLLVLLVDVLLIGVLWRLQSAQAGRASTLLKAAMVVGMAALALAG